MKRLHPLHDTHGNLYPELDWRWVTGATMVEYLDGIARDTLMRRTVAKHYGWGRQQGVQHVRQHDTDRGRIEYRPALIWQLRRMGRYGDERFCWQQLDGKVSVHACALGESPRSAATPAVAVVGEMPVQVQALLADLARSTSSAMALLTRASTPSSIPFPSVVPS